MTQRRERFQALYENTLPNFIEQPHIVIGCGAIGGVICQILGQIGVDEVHLWDHDTVEEVNLGPQGFEQSLSELNTAKVNSRQTQIRRLSSHTEIKPYDSRFRTKARHPKQAYWWLMVDDLDAREAIFETTFGNEPCEIIDARMGGVVYEVYNPTRHSPTRYMQTIEAARQNTAQEACTSRSTPHCAMIAGAIAINMALASSPPFCVKGDILAYNQEVIW